MADYFTAETDRYIASFIKAETIEEKHRLFEEGIRPAFEELIDSQIRVYKFGTIDDPDTLRREALSNLYEMIPKFDPNRGTKGFSYFNVVSKNYFIYRIRDKKKRAISESELYYDLDREIVRNDPAFSLSPDEDRIVDKEFWVALFGSMERWRKEELKGPERKVLEAIIFLLRNSELASIHNKKATYIYIRDITGLSTKQVVVALKRLRALYLEFKDEFDTYGEAI